MKRNLLSVLWRLILKSQRCAWLVAALMILVPRQAWGGACTCARFNDFKDFGCHKAPGGPGAPPSGADNPGSNKSKCPNCPPPNGPLLAGQDASDVTTGALGMPRWWVDEPYINLHVADEPLSYVTSSGQQMTFRFLYKENFNLPAPDQVPNLYTILDGMADNEDYIFQMRGFGWTNDGGGAAWPGMMTNASWSHNWMMNICFWDIQDYTNFAPIKPPAYSLGYEALVFTPEGGIYYFTSNNTNQTLNPNTMLTDPVSQVQLQPLSSYPKSGNSGPDTNGIYWGNSTDGFKLTYPDGSQDVFGLAYSPGSIPEEAEAFLTQRIDPQGRVTRIGYEFGDLTNSCYSQYGEPVLYSDLRVKYVVDTDGRTNTFTYSTNSPTHVWELTGITSPFTNKVTLTYGPCDDGILESITDAAGNSNYFGYQTSSYTSSYGINFEVNGGMSQITTPYGTTSFYYQDVMDPTDTTYYQMRAIGVTEPTGANQLFGYYHNSSNLVESSATSPTVTGGWVFDNGSNGGADDALYHRNSFHWDRLQTANLSLSSGEMQYPASTIASMGSNALQVGQMQHWLLDTDGISITETLSSERDPSPDPGGTIEGERTWFAYTNNTPPDVQTTSQVGCVAQILPNGSNQYTCYSYYSSGLVENNLQTYSLPGSGVGFLTNWFTYAGNAIDLTKASNSLGQYVTMQYNGNHQVTNITDALGETTTIVWNNSSGNYNLSSITYPNGQSVSFSYYASNTGGHIYSTNSFISQITVQPNNRTNFIVNYTNALPQVMHVTGSGIPDLWTTNTWDGLRRLTGTTFQDGTTSSNIYTNLDLEAHKDRVGNWTYFTYDGLQHLLSITNALSNVTKFTWCDCGSLTGISNALNRFTSLNRNNQGLLTNVVFPDLSSMNWQYDLTGRLTNTSDGAGVSQQYYYNIQDDVVLVSNVYGPLFGAFYDAVGRPLWITNANSVVISNSFDLIDRLLSLSWLNGGIQNFGYGTNGLTAYTNQDSQWTHFGRDSASRLIGATNAVQTNKFAYNGLDEGSTLIDGLNHTTLWSFNQYGWMTNKANTLGTNILTNGYDADGRVTSRWMMGTNTQYRYDAVGNLTNIIYPSFTNIYSFDAIRELTNMIDPSGTNSFTWTSNSQIATATAPWASNTISYGYNQGHRSSLSLSQPGGSAWSLTYNYDSAWRLTSIISPAGAFTYQYSSGANQYLVAGVSLPNAALTINQYDNLSRLTNTALVNYWGHTLDGYTNGLDALGLKTSITRELGLTTNTVTILYDPIAQVTSWTAKEANGTSRQNEQLGYAYDAAGNVHFRTNNALVQTFTVNQLNQLSNVTYSGTLTVSGSLPAPATNVTVDGNPAQTNGDFTFASSGNSISNGTNTFTIFAANVYGTNVTNTLTVNLPTTVTFQYDANGNLTNDGTRSFNYDAENQLTNVFVSNQWRAGFVYDGMGLRRIKRQYSWQGSTWTLTNEVHYIYDGSLVIQERDTNNNVLVTYTRGLDLSGTLQGAGGIGGLLARTDTNGTTFYHCDGSGNITALMDANQNIVARYEYDAFGRLIGMWGTNAAANVYRFSSKEYDALTGLYYYGRRYYDPVLQRWLNRDPIQESGGINLYGFVGNSPLNNVDPNGLVWALFSGEAWSQLAHDWFIGDHGPALDPNAKGYSSTPLTDENGNVVSGSQAVIQVGMAVPNGFLQAGMLMSGAKEEQMLAKESEGWLAKLWSKCKFWKKPPKPPHIALGYRSGLRQFADSIGADHLLGLGENEWQQALLDHIADPSAQFSVRLDGLIGDTVESMVQNEIKNGVNTGWELQQLQQAGRLGQVDFYLGGALQPNPFAP